MNITSKRRNADGDITDQTFQSNLANNLAQASSNLRASKNMFENSPSGVNNLDVAIATIPNENLILPNIVNNKNKFDTDKNKKESDSRVVFTDDMNPSLFGWARLPSAAPVNALLDSILPNISEKESIV